MRMLNGELKGFVEFLMDVELAGKQSRMRSRFVKLVSERVQEMEDARIAVVNKYANKGEDGQPLTVTTPEGATVYDIPEENRFALDQEYDEVLREEFILDESEERLDMLRTVRDAVLNVETKFSGIDALRYDRWCDVVEEIK